MKTNLFRYLYYNNIFVCFILLLLPHMSFSEILMKTYPLSGQYQDTQYFDDNNQVIYENVCYDNYGDVISITRTGKLPDGTINEYFKNGRIKRTVAIKDGKRNGFLKEYDILHNIIEESKYNNDIIIDKNMYYSNKILKSKEHYYFNNEQKRCIVIKEYYNNGNLMYEYNIIDGIVNGEYKYYYKSGNLAYERYYSSGKLNGIYNEYLENGNIYSRIIFKDNVNVYFYNTTLYYLLINYILFIIIIILILIFVLRFLFKLFNKTVKLKSIFSNIITCNDINYKDPWLMVTLSYIWPGSGHFIAGSKKRGIIFFSAFIFIILLLYFCLFSSSITNPFSVIIILFLLVLIKTYICFDSFYLTKYNYLKNKSSFRFVFLSVLFPGTGELFSGKLLHGIIYITIFILLLNITLYSFFRLYFDNIIIYIFIFVLQILSVFIVLTIFNINNKNLKIRIEFKKFVIILLALLSTIIINISFTILLFKFNITFQRADFNSMYKTIPHGSYVLIDKSMNNIINTYSSKNKNNIFNIRRSDIILFKQNNTDTIKVLKRCIGLPGETIEIRNKIVYINNNKLNETCNIFLDSNILSKEEDIRDNFGPIVIPEDSVFVLGDNRDLSKDSRHFGFVKIESIIGRAYKIFWPYIVSKKL